MASSAAGSNDSRREGTDKPEPSSEVPDRSPSPISPFFERVLSETASVRETVEALSSEEFAGLLAVAERHRGEALCLHPIGKELVLAMLTVGGEAFVAVPGGLSKMAEEIAATMFDDPWARGRLMSLWTRLSEVLP